MTRASKGADKLRLAESELAAGRIAQAIELLRAAGRLERDSPRPGLLLAYALSRADQGEEAIRVLRRVIERFPSNGDAWFNLGNFYRAQSRTEEAAHAFQRAASLNLKDAAAHINLAYVLVRLGRFEQAEVALRSALSRFPAEPDLLVNLGQIQRATHRLDEAIATLDRCVALAPAHAGYRLTRAIVRAEAGHVDEAKAELDALIATLPEAADARFARAQILLSRGEYVAGWHDYLWRPARARWLHAQGCQPGSPPPGLHDLQGRELVLCGEQGLGDTLFFLRFAPALAEVAASVRLEVDARLHAILPAQWERATGDRALRVLAGDAPAILESTRAPSLRLQPNAVRVAKLRELLARCGPAPRIGITWQAGVRPEETEVPGESLFKRIPPERLGHALRGAPGTLISLQRGALGNDLEELSGAAGRPIHDFSWVNQDIADALALLESLDDYVAVSNTNVHLADALGKAARVLITHPAEWRWTAAHLKSPWFPAAILYRQARDGSWDEALSRLARELGAK
jgi:tetratricopeptide (TPR) repeat protein